MDSHLAPLELRNLTKTYGTLRAVDGISLTMRPGEIFGLLGPNGAGKTSIISILTTLTSPSSGEALIFGERVGPKNRLVKRFLGCVPQEIVSHGFFSVEEVLAFHSGYYGIADNREQINYLLKKLGLDEHRTKRVRQLSGGMKRRLLIAKALVHRPKLLLLDEPTAGVDVELRASLWAFVRELNQQGVSVLLTTHYLEEAESLCHRVGVIHHGKLLKVDDTQALVRGLTQREVTLFLEAEISALSHPWLVEQRSDRIVFRVPSHTALGHLIREAHVPASAIRDVRIREGRLEDAFVHLVKDH